MSFVGPVSAIPQPGEAKVLTSNVGIHFYSVSVSPVPLHLQEQHVFSEVQFSLPLL